MWQTRIDFNPKRITKEIRNMPFSFLINIATILISFLRGQIPLKNMPLITINPLRSSDFADPMRIRFGRGFKSRVQQFTHMFSLLRFFLSQSSFSTPICISFISEYILELCAFPLSVRIFWNLRELALALRILCATMYVSFTNSHFLLLFTFSLPTCILWTNAHSISLRIFFTNTHLSYPCIFHCCVLSFARQFLDPCAIFWGGGLLYQFFEESYY